MLLTFPCNKILSSDPGVPGIVWKDLSGTLPVLNPEEVRSFWPSEGPSQSSHCSMVRAHSVLQPTGTISMGGCQRMILSAKAMEKDGFPPRLHGVFGKKGSRGEPSWIMGVNAISGSDIHDTNGSQKKSNQTM